MQDSLFPLDEAGIVSIVDDVRRDVRYVTTDFSVALIIDRFRESAEDEGDVYIPSYQRALAWGEDKMSYFIESLVLRVPITPIFFYEVAGKLEIVDGSQRIRSLVKFVNGDYRLNGLEKLEILNGLSYFELPSTIQRRLLNTPIRSFVLDESTDESTRIDVFRRLNTSGKKLADAEIRKGVFQGPFLDLVLRSAESPLFKWVTPKMAKGSDPNSERQELATRFYVYSDHYMEFTHDVRKFLDEKMIEMNETSSDADMERREREFISSMEYIREHMPKAFYRTESGSIVPRVRFEAIAVGVNLALRAGKRGAPSSTDFLRSLEFKNLVRTDASNSAPKLRARVEFVRDALIGGANGD